jgi:hypothetical protein
MLHLVEVLLHRRKPDAGILTALIHGMILSAFCLPEKQVLSNATALT